MTTSSILKCTVVVLSFAWNSSASRCFSQGRGNSRAAKFLRASWAGEIVSAVAIRQELWQYWNGQTCSSFKLQTSSVEYNNRSLSPWRYRIDDEEDRIPRQIAMAECLCKGCIINQHEDMSYNSVPVNAKRRVLKITVCPSDPQQYVIKADYVTIPVACTCVLPRMLP